MDQWIAWKKIYGKLELNVEKESYKQNGIKENYRRWNKAYLTFLLSSFILKSKWESPTDKKRWQRRTISTGINNLET